MNSYLKRSILWVDKHQETIIIGSVITVGIVLFVAVVKADIDSHQKAVTQLANNINELNAWHAAEQMAA